MCHCQSWRVDSVSQIQSAITQVDVRERSDSLTFAGDSSSPNQTQPRALSPLSILGSTAPLLFSSTVEPPVRTRNGNLHTGVRTHDSPTDRPTQRATLAARLMPHRATSAGWWAATSKGARHLQTAGRLRDPGHRKSVPCELASSYCARPRDRSARAPRRRTCEGKRIEMCNVSKHYPAIRARMRVFAIYYR